MKRSLKSIDRGLLGKRVTVHGWIEDKRPLGKIIFLTLRDQDGKIQLVARRGEGSVFEKCERVAKQSVVEAVGVIREAFNRLEVELEDLRVIAEAKHPLPLDPTGRTPATLPTMLDARPLSLRIPEVAAIFKARSKVLKLIREFFYQREFIEVNTPKLIATATEGGADLFRVEYFDRDAYLAQSPQLYKEQLMLAFDKVFEIAHYFRAEKSHTTKHLTEFVSVDVEMAYSNYFDVMDLLEELIKYVFSRVGEECREELEVLGYSPPKPPEKFKRITYDECVELLRREGYEHEWGEDFGADELRVVGEKIKTFYFIYDWPKAAKPFYIEVKEGREELTESFDLMFKELELASGGTRVSDPERLKRRLVENGLNAEDFKTHLKFFYCGMPPHAGFGLGLDRMMLIVTGKTNVREVVLYPRDPERIIP